MQKLTKEEEYFFKERLLEAIYDNQHPLPTDLEMNKTYRTQYFKYDNRGGRDLKFAIKKNSNGKLFLDFYLKTDDYTTHKRIDHTGEVIELENYEAQFGWPLYDDQKRTELEHKKIKEYNQKVYDMLKHKGFEE